MPAARHPHSTAPVMIGVRRGAVDVVAGAGEMRVPCLSGLLNNSCTIPTPLWHRRGRSRSSTAAIRDRSSRQGVPSPRGDALPVAVPSGAVSAHSVRANFLRSVFQSPLLRRAAQRRQFAVGKDMAWNKANASVDRFGGGPHKRIQRHESHNPVVQEQAARLQQPVSGREVTVQLRSSHMRNHADTWRQEHPAERPRTPHDQRKAVVAG